MKIVKLFLEFENFEIQEPKLPNKLSNKKKNILLDKYYSLVKNLYHILIFNDEKINIIRDIHIEFFLDEVSYNKEKHDEYLEKHLHNFTKEEVKDRYFENKKIEAIK